MPVLPRLGQVLFINHKKALFPLLHFVSLEKETQDLASEMLPPGFFVIHDTTRGSHDDVTVK